MNRAFGPVASLVLSVALAVLSAGCGSGQATPMATMQKMLTALETGKKADFVACWGINEEQKRFIAALWDIDRQLRRLKDGIREAYGPEGLAAFHTAPGLQTQGFDETLEKDVSKLSVKTVGETALCTSPGSDKPLRMVRIEDRWVADTEAALTPMITVERVLQLAPKMEGVVDRVVAQVGQADVTPARLKGLYTREIVMAIMGPVE